MDLVSRLPRSPRCHDVIWEIVDRLTKFAYFLATCLTDSTDVFSRLYNREIVHLHGIPITIIFYRTRDSHLISREVFKGHWGHSFN